MNLVILYILYGSLLQYCLLMNLVIHSFKGANDTAIHTLM